MRKKHAFDLKTPESFGKRLLYLIQYRSPFYGQSKILVDIQKSGPVDSILYIQYYE
jgi:hypothetical protein